MLSTHIIKSNMMTSWTVNEDLIVYFQIAFQKNNLLSAWFLSKRFNGNLDLKIILNTQVEQYMIEKFTCPKYIQVSSFPWQNTPLSFVFDKHSWHITEEFV